MEDTRNVMDEFKNKPLDEIVATLDTRGVELEIAIENLERDFNMGTIVRSANAFGIRTVHIVGRRQWNKRGAMMTDKYLKVIYHASVEEFVQASRPKVIVAVDNVERSADIRTVKKQQSEILVFGAEGPGLSQEMLSAADVIVAIPQRGSTRSLNVGVAAGIAMWEWLR
ncbi:TrmH family RNA methyltransferase, partial [Candidatus Saccharibacteria bacterium]|nr:TrmH family RNA methyltransferase [Candidatus Saccharibacteria bacterium]